MSGVGVPWTVLIHPYHKYRRMLLILRPINHIANNRTNAPISTVLRSLDSIPLTRTAFTSLCCLSVSFPALGIHLNSNFASLFSNPDLLSTIIAQNLLLNNLCFLASQAGQIQVEYEV